MVELWSWLYTDELGTRRIYNSKLSVEDAKTLKDATRLEGTLEMRPVPAQLGMSGQSKEAAAESPGDLLTLINRAILVVSRLREISKNSEPETRTLLAELANVLAGARMDLAMQRARLVEPKQAPPAP